MWQGDAGGHLLEPALRQHFVRTVFHRHSGGESTEYWEAEWAGSQIGGAADDLLTGDDRTLEILGRHVPAAGRVLEAGCGPCRYAAAVRSPQRTVFGVDLAGRTLARVSQERGDVHVCRGDVRAMPFGSDTFDAVISLGVVEHDPAGPAAALAEHVRVLRPGGLLLISVPWVSPLKRAFDVWNWRVQRRSTYESRGRLVADLPVAPASAAGSRIGAFHQFEFTTAQWRRALSEAGVRTVAEHRYGVMWGLGDLAGLLGYAPKTEAAPPVDEMGASVSAPRTAAGSGAKAFVRRVLIGERPRNPLERVMSAAAGATAGHLILTVAQKP